MGAPSRGEQRAASWPALSSARTCLAGRPRDASRRWRCLSECTLILTLCHQLTPGLWSIRGYVFIGFLLVLSGWHEGHRTSVLRSLGISSVHVSCSLALSSWLCLVSTYPCTYPSSAAAPQCSKVLLTRSANRGDPRCVSRKESMLLSKSAKPDSLDNPDQWSFSLSSLPHGQPMRFALPQELPELAPAQPPPSSLSLHEHSTPPGPSLQHSE